MIIEDDADNRETLRDLLAHYGYEVEVAVTGKEGLRKALQEGFDVTLVDLSLPELSGLAVAQRLSQARGNRPFIVAVTGWGRAEDVEKTRSAGFDCHLLKPIDHDRLLALLEDQCPRDRVV